MAQLCHTPSVAIIALSLVGTSAAAAAGPYVVGNRAFAATPTTDDPFVADDVTLSGTHTRQGSTSSSPTLRDSEFEAEISKRLTESVGLSVEGGYEIEDPVGAPSQYGFDDVSATIKYQFYQSDAHEFLTSLGVIREFGGTGAARVGADPVSTTTPSFYVGKGMGDLPDGLALLRPIALTGTFGYQVADTRSPAEPDLIVAGLSIQYSLRYLEGNVRYLGLPEFIDRLTPLVEIAYTTPSSRAAGITTIGTIAPGVIYGGNHIDLGVEALIPATKQAGTNLGFIVSLHWRPGGLFERVLGGDEP
jgi:hypothetical protein